MSVDFKQENQHRQGHASGEEAQCFQNSSEFWTEGKMKLTKENLELNSQGPCVLSYKV